MVVGTDVNVIMVCLAFALLSASSGTAMSLLGTELVGNRGHVWNCHIVQGHRVIARSFDLKNPCSWQSAVDNEVFFLPQTVLYNPKEHR